MISLQLEGNPIGIKGASAFAVKLLRNASLITLDLCHESIGPEGTQKLIDSLSQNSTLEIVRLPGKYKSSVSASEPYRRVEGRIQWGKSSKYFVLHNILGSTTNVYLSFPI